MTQNKKTAQSRDESANLVIDGHTIRNVYFAGKVSDDDWRDQVVGGVEIWYDPDDPDDPDHPGNPNYLENSDGRYTWDDRTVFALSDDKEPGIVEIRAPHVSDRPQAWIGYTGPFWYSDSDCSDSCQPRSCVEPHAHPRALVNSLIGIDRCDTLFAWINSTDCFGTIAEIGYARAKGKFIIVVLDEDLDATELWFPAMMANLTLVDESPGSAWGYLWIDPPSVRQVDFKGICFKKPISGDPEEILAWRQAIVNKPNSNTVDWM